MPDFLTSSQTHTQIRYGFLLLKYFYILSLFKISQFIRILLFVIFSANYYIHKGDTVFTMSLLSLNGKKTENKCLYLLYS